VARNTAFEGLQQVAAGQGASAGVTAFAEALAKHRQLRLQHLALAEEERKNRAAESLRAAMMPQTLDLGGTTPGGTTSSRRGGGGTPGGEPPVSNADILANLSTEQGAVGGQLAEAMRIMAEREKAARGPDPIDLAIGKWQGREAAVPAGAPLNLTVKPGEAAPLQEGVDLGTGKVAKATAPEYVRKPLETRPMTPLEELHADPGYESEGAKALEGEMQRRSDMETPGGGSLGAIERPITEAEIAEMDAPPLTGYQKKLQKRNPEFKTGQRVDIASLDRKDKNKLSDARKWNASLETKKPALAAAVEAVTPGTHAVVKGETLGAIAKKTGTTVDAIVKANRIADPNKIEVGQSLTIPAVSAPRVDEAVPVVKIGEELVAPEPAEGSVAAEIVKAAPGKRRNELAFLSDHELKAKIDELTKKEGALRNPLAVASDGLLPDSHLPAIEQVELAAAEARQGNRARISRIVGRTVTGKEVRDGDVDKWAAQYRSFASGLNVRADEIRADRWEAEKIQRQEGYEGKSRMWELTFRSLFPMEKGESKEGYNERVKDFHKFALDAYEVGGDRSVEGYLDRWAQLEKDRRSADLNAYKASSSRSRSKARGAVGKSGSMVDYFKYIDDEQKQNQIADDLIKEKAETLLTAGANLKEVDGRKETIDEAKKRVSDDYDRRIRNARGRASEFRKRAEQERVKVQGISPEQRVALGGMFRSDFESSSKGRKSQRQIIKDSGNSEDAWGAYAESVRSYLAVTYGAYPTLSEDVDYVVSSMRTQYAAGAPTKEGPDTEQARGGEPDVEAEPYPEYREPLSEEAAELAGKEGVKQHEARRRAGVPGLEAKRDEIAARTKIYRNDLIQAVDSGDTEGVVELRNKVFKSIKKMKNLSDKWESSTGREVSKGKEGAGWGWSERKLLREIENTTLWKRAEAARIAHEYAMSRSMPN
jgi:LysM repeat protein